MKKTFGLFTVLAVMWWLWSGLTMWLILGFGLFSCVLVSTLSQRMNLVDAEGLQIHLLPKLARYWGWLIVEILKSNVDVTRQILSGKIRPATKKIPTHQASDLERVIYANSITLTPGTLSYELDSEYIHVHALHADSLEDLDTGAMAAEVRKVEGQS